MVFWTILGFFWTCLIVCCEISSDTSCVNHLPVPWSVVACCNVSTPFHIACRKLARAGSYRVIESRWLVAPCLSGAVALVFCWAWISSHFLLFPLPPSSHHIFFISSSLTRSFKIYSTYFRFLKGQWTCISGDASQMFWFFPFDSCKSDGAQLSCPFLMPSKFLCDKLHLRITGRKEL